MTRIAFLDIDGPMIPSTFVLVDRRAGWERRFPRVTIAVVNELHRRSGALVVLNTTHVESRPGVPDIEKALVTHGLDRSALHPTDARTTHPVLPRTEAIAEWLSRHPETTDWIALDNEVFMTGDALIWVDPDSGLTLSHLNQALKTFGCRPVTILV